MSQSYNARLRGLLFVCLALCGAGALAAQTADLSLALAQSSDEPARYTAYSVTVAVTNDGPDAATGVVVDLPRPDGVVFTGGDESRASQGRYRPYTTQEWTVGTLAAGQTATLTLNLFLLDPTAPDYYGQVGASAADDPDSTPGNGRPGVVNEDDEASVRLGTGGGGGTGADLSLAFTSLGEPAVFTDYSTTLTLRNDGPEAATGIVVSVPFEQGAGAVFVGGNEAVASRGTYSPYGRQRWRVGALASGETATLRLNFFRRRGDLQQVYAQVLAADQADPDSTPGNGTPPRVNEDDEVRTDGGDDGGGGGDCGAFATLFDGFTTTSPQLGSFSKTPSGFALGLTRFNPDQGVLEERRFLFEEDGTFLTGGDVTRVPRTSARIDRETDELVLTTDGEERRVGVDVEALVPAGLSLDGLSVRAVEGGYLLLATSGEEPFGSAGPFTLTGALVGEDFSQGPTFTIATGLDARGANSIETIRTTSATGYVLVTQAPGASTYYFFDTASGRRAAYVNAYGGRPRFVQAVGVQADGTVTIVDRLEGADATLPLDILDLDPATGTLLRRRSSSTSLFRGFRGQLVLPDGTVAVGLSPNAIDFVAPDGSRTFREYPGLADLTLFAPQPDGSFFGVAAATDREGEPTGQTAFLRFGADGQPFCEGRGPTTAVDLGVEITAAPTVTRSQFGDRSLILNFRYALRNTGTRSVPESTPVQVRAFVSTDATLSDDDVAGTRLLNLPGLRANGEYVNNSAFEILPEPFAPGDYFLILVADPNDAIAEGDEGNNTAAVAFTYAGEGGPATVAVSPNPARRGGELRVAFEPSEADAADAADTPEPTLLQVVDQRGRIVHTRALPTGAGGRYDLSDLDLPAGWYTIHLPGTAAAAQRVLVTE